VYGGDGPAPLPAIETAAYRLLRDDAGRKFWAFQGWPT
jgi:hypothetical protein